MLNLLVTRKPGTLNFICSYVEKIGYQQGRAKRVVCVGGV